MYLSAGKRILTSGKVRQCCCGDSSSSSSGDYMECTYCGHIHQHVQVTFTGVTLASCQQTYVGSPPGDPNQYITTAGYLTSYCIVLGPACSGIKQYVRLMACYYDDPDCHHFDPRVGSFGYETCEELLAAGGVGTECTVSVQYGPRSSTDPTLGWTVTASGQVSATYFTGFLAASTCDLSSPVVVSNTAGPIATVVPGSGSYYAGEGGVAVISGGCDPDMSSVQSIASHSSASSSSSSGNPFGGAAPSAQFSAAQTEMDLQGL